MQLVLGSTWCPVVCCEVATQLKLSSACY